MDTKEYLGELNAHLSHLYAFARQINELDFAASLSGEFRGAQDPGWNTTITAYEVFKEISISLQKKAPLAKAELRIILMLYCQLAEAGGVYETLKNICGVVTLKPYLLWPFQELVRVRKEPHRVIGPNANATFRDLATTAKEIGLSRLSSLLEQTFRDDIRNGIYHADYVIWDDGLRLRNRNGGYAAKVPYADVNAALTRAIGFFQLLMDHNEVSVRSFNPPKEIVGRFSANFPMPWTVSFDPESGAFGISGSSPGSVITPEYQRQLEINGRLGGKVLSAYSIKETNFQKKVDAHILNSGFEPNNVAMNPRQLGLLVLDIDRLNLWDERHPHANQGEVLLASPWGFRWLYSLKDFDSILQKPLVDFEIVEGEPS
jgi:hypothetical protein